MKQRSILFLTLTILAACNQSSNEELDIQDQINNKELSFEEYLSIIPTIEIPIILNCEYELRGSDLNFDQKEIDKFGLENSNIYGKIAVTKDFAAIIYLYPADIVLPIIQTTDRNGNKISELQLYDKWCGEDEFSWGTSWADISKDLIITLSDSAIVYKRNDVGEIIEASKTTEVRHRKYKIDNNGRINDMSF